MPALRASSASMRSDSWRSRASTLWREIAASETQPTAVLRDSKAVNSTMSGFERRSLRATKTSSASRRLTPASVVLAGRPGFVHCAPAPAPPRANPVRATILCSIQATGQTVGRIGSSWRDSVPLCHRQARVLRLLLGTDSQVRVRPPVGVARFRARRRSLRKPRKRHARGNPRPQCHGSSLPARR